LGDHITMTDVNYKAENPFEDTSEFVNGGASRPPGLPQKTSARNSSNNDPALASKISDLRRREDELNRREDTLDKRGQVLVDREKRLKSPRAPNWPRCRPLVYQDIEGEMPSPEAFRVVRYAYYGWIATVAMLLLNLGVLLGSVIVEDGDGDSVPDFILAIVYFIFFPVLWFGIYRILYKAARKSKPSLFIIYFVCYIPLTVAGYILFAVGIPGFGMAGYILTFKEFEDSVAEGVILLICAIGWTLLSAFHCWLFNKARLAYISAGALDKAKKEFASSAAEQAKKHPELLKKGTEMAVQEAVNNPDLVKQGIKQGVNASNKV